MMFGIYYFPGVCIRGFGYPDCVIYGAIEKTVNALTERMGYKLSEEVGRIWESLEAERAVNFRVLASDEDLIRTQVIFSYLDAIGFIPSTEEVETEVARRLGLQENKV